jgi:hypothetical protein
MTTPRRIAWCGWNAMKGISHRAVDAMRVCHAMRVGKLGDGWLSELTLGMIDFAD